MKEKMMDTNYAFKNSENVFVPKQYTEEKKEQLYYCVYLEDGLASIDFTLGIIRWEFYIF